MKTLSHKERRFVAEYLVDHNGTQAAIRAGYSAKTACEQASRLLAKVKVRAAVEKKLQVVEEKALVTKEYVIKSIKEVVERCMQHEPVMEFDHVEKELVQKKVFDMETGKMVGVYEFDSSGANKGLENLGRHLKLFTDKVEATITDSIADRLKRARDRAKK